MENAFAELPLALFTTLAPIGAGGFIALCATAYAGGLEGKAASKSDAFAVASLGIVLLGLVASVFHLGDPTHMPLALSGIGTSPLTNEICMALAFIVVAVAYLVAARRLSASGRRAFLLVVALFALLLACFTGLAYMIPTVASWSTPLNSVQEIGYALVGGAALISLLKSPEGSAPTVARVLPLVSLAGLVVSAIGVLGQVSLVSGISTFVVSGSTLVAGALALIVCGLVALAASTALTFLAARKANAALGIAAFVLAVAGVLCLRLSFYAMQVSVGIYYR